MIVPVIVAPPNAFSPKLPPSVATLGHDEVFLIELQGTLDVQCPETTTRDGQLIGMLNTADMNKPTLMIGHHLLEGKVVSLPKPLGVLHKRVRSLPPSDGGDDDNNSASTGDPNGHEEKQKNEQVQWEVMAVVKKKMVFAKRPMPIAKAKPVSTASASRRR